MNLGGPELIIQLMIPLLVATIGLTIWALVDSGSAVRRASSFGIIVAWVFGLGWLVAVIYLLAVRPGLVRAERPPADPYNPGWG
jgi:ABC-type multidrug transport system permease subunit